MKQEILLKYEIKKDDKTDMLSSLKKLDKKLLDKVMEKECAEDIKDLAKMIIDEFKYLLSISKDDVATQVFFEHLLDCEDTPIFAAYQSDVESLYVFVYDNGKYLSYYIPDEIKEEIIRVFINNGQVINKKKVGRNEPCPCGSGRKYKFCCGK